MSTRSEIISTEAAAFFVKPFLEKHPPLIAIQPNPTRSSIFAINLPALDNQDTTLQISFDSYVEDAALEHKFTAASICGTGKSRFAQTLADRLGKPYIYILPDLKYVTVPGKNRRSPQSSLLVVPNIRQQYINIAGTVQRLRTDHINVSHVLTVVDDATPEYRQKLSELGIQLVGVTTADHILTAIADQDSSQRTQEMIGRARLLFQ